MNGYESCFIIRTGKVTLDPEAAGARLTKFYGDVDELYKADPAGEANESVRVAPNVLRYMKAATKATNDKYARVDRAEVIAPLLVGEPTPPKTDKKNKGKSVK